MVEGYGEVNSIRYNCRILHRKVYKETHGYPCTVLNRITTCKSNKSKLSVTVVGKLFV